MSKTDLLATLRAVLWGTGKPSAPETAPSSPRQTATGGASPFYDFIVRGIDGRDVDLARFKGKKVLVVNVASKCGFTRQYAELQELHEKYGDKVTVLGFPANNFLWQEPGSNADIASFCQVKYGVTFPMFEKISVRGAKQHPLYCWLSNKSLNGVIDQAPRWNFCKYLLDEEGNALAFYPSKVSPLDESIVSAIEGNFNSPGLFKTAS
jgi:glutathione peroxidase